MLKSTDITNNLRIDNVEVTKSFGTGLNLYYECDGKPYNITGEFWIDRKQVLHHTHEDENGTEIEILVQLEY